MVGTASLIMQVLHVIERARQKRGLGLLVLLFGVYGEERGIVTRSDGAVALARDIHDLPVAKLASSAQ